MGSVCIPTIVPKVEAGEWLLFKNSNWANKELIRHKEFERIKKNRITREHANLLLMYVIHCNVYCTVLTGLFYNHSTHKMAPRKSYSREIKLQVVQFYHSATCTKLERKTTWMDSKTILRWVNQ